MKKAKTEEQQNDKLPIIELDTVVLPVNMRTYCFKLTLSSFQGLENDGIPEPVLESLRSLKDKEFLLKKELVDAVEKQIGKEQTAQYKDLILKHVDLHVLNERFSIEMDMSGKSLYRAGSFGKTDGH